MFDWVDSPGLWWQSNCDHQGSVKEVRRTKETTRVPRLPPAVGFNYTLNANRMCEQFCPCWNAVLENGAVEDRDESLVILRQVPQSGACQRCLPADLASSVACLQGESSEPHPSATVMRRQLVLDLDQTIL